MFLVGLTGGIASGKSTVSRMLQELGCAIIDADLVAREVVEPGKPAWKKIKKIFGSDVIKGDGSINRDRLGQIIFMDPSKRRQLNAITHPEIFKTMMWQILGTFVKGYRYVILDLPLLFESGSFLKYLNKIVVVNCDDDAQLTRLMKRNNYSVEDAKQRINAQLPLAEKCLRATHVVDNNGTTENTRIQVMRIHKELQSSKQHIMIRGFVLLSLGVVLLVCKYLLNYSGFKIL